MSSPKKPVTETTITKIEKPVSKPKKGDTGIVSNMGSGLGPNAPWYAKFFDRAIFSWLSKFSPEAKALLLAFIALVAGFSYSVPIVVEHIHTSHRTEHQAFSEDLESVNKTVMELIRELRHGHKE